MVRVLNSAGIEYLMRLKLYAVKIVAVIFVMSCVLACRREAPPETTAAENTASAVNAAGAERKLPPETSPIDDEGAADPGASTVPQKASSGSAVPASVTPDDSAEIFVSTAPLGKALAAEAGGPALLVLTKNGVVAWGADQGWTKVLVRGPVDQAAYDSSFELLWLLRSGRLEVMDFRQPPGQTVLIATGMPSAEFQVLRDSGRGVTSSRAAGQPQTEASIQIKWTDPPAITANFYNPLDDVGDDEDHTARVMAEGLRLAAQAGLTGTEWLISQLPRSRTAPVFDLNFPQRQFETKDCDNLYGKDPKCGPVRDFGVSGRKIVQTTFFCGDACYSQCILYDPEKERWAATPLDEWKSDTKGRGPCGTYSFDLRGKWVIYHHAVCPADGSRLCAELDGEPLGWLRAGARIY